MLLSASGAFSQTQTGSLVGRVHGPHGSGVAGVQVDLKQADVEWPRSQSNSQGPQRTGSRTQRNSSGAQQRNASGTQLNPQPPAQTKSSTASQIIFHTVTDAKGRFYFVGLPPGDYSLELSLSGRPSQNVSNLHIRQASMLDVSILLWLNISMSGQAVIQTLPPPTMPTSLKRRQLVDLFDRGVWVGRRFGEPSLQELPTSRRIWSILEDQDVSAVTDHLDIGGLETGTRSVFGSLGASWTEGRYSLNGLDLTDPYTSGRPLADPDYDALRDLTTVTAAKPASFSGSGANIELHTPTLIERQENWVKGKRGYAVAGAAGDKEKAEAGTHGLLRGYFSNGALQSNNISQRKVQLGFPGAERLNHLVDVSGQLSGGIALSGSSLPFFLSLSTQQLSKELGGFPLPITAHVYHALTDLTLLSSGSKRLNLLYAGQHVFNSREGAAPRVAPSATLRGNDNFHQFQARWFSSPSEASRLELSFGAAHAIVSSGIQPGSFGTSTVDLPQVSQTGPAPLSFAGTRTRYQANSVLQTFREGPLGSHSLNLGATFDRSNITNRWDALGGSEQILIEGTGAEVVRWNTPKASREHVQNFALFSQDAWRPTTWLAVNVGIRLENSSGQANGANNRVGWTTFTPRAGFVMQLPVNGFVLRANFARYGHVLQGSYFDFGNSQAVGGQVFGWLDSNLDRQAQAAELTEVLRVFGGPYSALDKDLRRPLTDEVALVLEKQFGRFVARARFFRRDDRHLIEIVNAGVPSSSYLPTVVIDPGNDGLAGTPDDARLVLFNRRPSALGKDFFVLTSPSGYGGSFKGFEIEALKRFSRHWEATGSFAAMHGSAPTNPGNGVFQNDPGVIISDMSIYAALNADPNTLLFANGRGFFDRGFTGKLSGYYEGPHGLRVAAVAKYYDGLPFARMLFVKGFNQGPFFVRATPRADFGAFRTQFNSTLDLRVAETFALRRGRIAFDVDVFNLLNLNKNTLEADLTSPTFAQRVPLATEAPRMLRLGVEWKF